MKDIIEAGEYVRTKNGKIDKVVSNNCYMGKYIKAEKDFIFCNSIVKHSKNIIDLIQVGDYVNSYKVIGVTLEPAPYGKCVDIDYESYLFEEQIYSIVTKEQFESMKYKVEE